MAFKEDYADTRKQIEAGYPPNVILWFRFTAIQKDDPDPAVANAAMAVYHNMGQLADWGFTPEEIDTVCRRENWIEAYYPQSKESDQ